MGNRELQVKQNYPKEVTDGRVVRAGVSETWTVLS